MDFGIMFFSSIQPEGRDRRYQLLLDSVRFADAHDFRCVWIPERHFHPFGGLYPNPSVIAAALAMITERLELRAGSLVSPLHDVIRIAENWSVVDNLSGGRVAVSFGSGWNVDDFVLSPESYETRRDVTLRQVEEVRALWRGEALRRKHGKGDEIAVEVFPKPVQEELPVWLTSSGNPETFADAGRRRANVLTHLIGQTLEELEEKIRSYRRAWREHHGGEHQGKVALMLHTFMGPDVAAVEAKVRKPFREYLRSAISLEKMSAEAGGAISGGHEIEAHDIPADVMEELLDVTFERYFHTAALLGTPASCERLVWRLAEIGIDEIACLIDFIDDGRAVLESLGYVDELRARFAEERVACDRAELVAGFTGDLEA